MKNKSLILLSKYHDQRVVKVVEKKVKASGPTGIQEYNQYIEEVDLSDRCMFLMKLAETKVRFDLRIFFDFLDTGVVNSNIIYDKMDSEIGISAMDFPFSLSRSLIRKFSNIKRAALVNWPSKNP